MSIALEEVDNPEGSGPNSATLHQLSALISELRGLHAEHQSLTSDITAIPDATQREKVFRIVEICGLHRKLQEVQGRLQEVNEETQKLRVDADKEARALQQQLFELRKELR